MPAKITRLTDELSVASQIDAADIARIAAEGFRTIINNRPDGEEAGQLTAAEGQRAAENLGLAYHYLPFTAATLTEADINAFDTLLAKAPGPILAHCRSGTRCSLIWAITELRKGHASAEDLVQQAADRGFEISALSRFA